MASLTRKSQGGRDRRRQEIRDLLWEAAAALMAEGESYAEISVERLVRRAGISRSTFYVYFEDKGDLLRAGFAQITDELQGAATVWWQLEGTIDREAVHVALRRIVTTYRPYTSLMATVYDAASYDATVRAEVTAMMDANTAGLRKHIRRGQAEGWIAPNLPPAETASWLTWMAERGFHVMLRAADDAETDALTDAYTDVIWNALYAFAPSRADSTRHAA